MKLDKQLKTLGVKKKARKAVAAQMKKDAKLKKASKKKAKKGSKKKK